MAWLPVAELVERIHGSPGRVALAVTGGGSRAIAELLEVAGASRTLTEAVVPYSDDALVRYLGGRPDQFSSDQTARAMAMTAFERSRADSSIPLSSLAGVGCTASLASDRPKRGPHRVHVAMQTVEATEVWSLELEKGRRSRREEETLCASLVLNAIAAVCGLDERIDLATADQEKIDSQRVVAPESWQHLLTGDRQAVAAGSLTGDTPAEVIFPGAFDPLHEGHREMTRVASEMLGGRVAYEISITNVEKPALDYLEIERRLQAMGDQPVWLTRATTFVEKSALFSGATFIVGIDTLARIADPKFYGDDCSRMAAALNSIDEKGCRFLVFGRLEGSRFVTLADLEIPSSLRDLCTEVPADRFRSDVSSTEMRRNKGGLSG